jgi:hypothetical protein
MPETPPTDRHGRRQRARVLSALSAVSTIEIPGPQIRALGTVQQLADNYAGHAKAPRTVKAYATDWRDFVAWTTAHDRQALPAEAETVATYVADLAARGVRPSTLSRRLVAISQAHKTVDLPSPISSSAVRRTFAGIRRSVSTAQNTKAPVIVDHLVLISKPRRRISAGCAIGRCC